MRRQKNSRGFTLLEAVLVLVVLSIAALGVGVSLQALAKSPVLDDEQLAISAELTSEMETWRATPFASLAIPTHTTDTVALSVGGQSKTYARTTDIIYLDPNNPSTNASPQTDFASVSVKINTLSATVWVTKP